MEKAPAPQTTPVQDEAMQVSADMRVLYNDFNAKRIDRSQADTLANIAGKNLKALSLVIADQLRADGHLQLIERTKVIENHS